MDIEKYIPEELKSKRILLNNNLTLDDLQRHLRLCFPSYKAAANAAGISEGRVRQLLIAYDLPKSAKLIYKISMGWHIDPIKLTLLFDRERKPKLNSKEVKK